MAAALQELRFQFLRRRVIDLDARHFSREAQRERVQSGAEDDELREGGGANEFFDAPLSQDVVKREPWNGETFAQTDDESIESRRTAFTLHETARKATPLVGNQMTIPRMRRLKRDSGRDELRRAARRILHALNIAL